ncbi:MAG: hypothetical protein FRX49_00622 [Trebouxia sp. A1-2]|nr:MAG: hypothetical protein FRX49_00622 [Trebouxia sp. A1-2]
MHAYQREDLHEVQEGGVVGQAGAQPQGRAGSAPAQQLDSCTALHNIEPPQTFLSGAAVRMNAAVRRTVLPQCLQALHFVNVANSPQLKLPSCFVLVAGADLFFDSPLREALCLSVR